MNYGFTLAGDSNRGSHRGTRTKTVGPNGGTSLDHSYQRNKSQSFQRHHYVGSIIIEKEARNSDLIVEDYHYPKHSDNSYIKGAQTNTEHVYGETLGTEVPMMRFKRKEIDAS
jgi:hypothetical protein